MVNRIMLYFDLFYLFDVVYGYYKELKFDMFKCIRKSIVIFIMFELIKQDNWLK